VEWMIARLKSSVVLAYANRVEIVLFRNGNNVENSQFLSEDNVSSKEVTHQTAIKDISPKYYSELRIHRITTQHPFFSKKIFYYRYYNNGFFRKSFLKSFLKRSTTIIFSRSSCLFHLVM
jgi:hypothetical protein